jgi:hypothetical protein
MSETTVTEVIDRDKWDDGGFVNMGIVATVYHDVEQNKGDGPNRHAIALGNDVFVFESE